MPHPAKRDRAKKLQFLINFQVGNRSDHLFFNYIKLINYCQYWYQNLKMVGF